MKYESKILEQQDIAFTNLESHYIRENIKMGVDKNNDIVLSWGEYIDYRIDLYKLKNAWMVLYINEGKTESINSFENLEDAVKSFSDLITISRKKQSL